MICNFTASINLIALFLLSKTFNFRFFLVYYFILELYFMLSPFPSYEPATYIRKNKTKTKRSVKSNLPERSRTAYCFILIAKDEL